MTHQHEPPVRRPAHARKSPEVRLERVEQALRIAIDDSETSILADHRTVGTIGRDGKVCNSKRNREIYVRCDDSTPARRNEHSPVMDFRLTFQCASGLNFPAVFFSLFAAGIVTTISLVISSTASR